MRAKAGDHLIIKSHRVGTPEVEAEVLDARGEHGEGPFLVRWLSDGHQGLYFPGPDTVVRHGQATRTKATQ